ncbi:MAG: T9SS type A sorting domain-containing protein [Chitinophagales bacterium]|nr:T9SS type A sorting domain-containing protein [Chitinophagales bacterium]MDW8273241.1 T9SS type A sorting domain-containing protein [Chitinophagales bacterium]
MKKTSYLYVIIINTIFICRAQFPGPAGTPGSTAIFKDSAIFVGWATGCTVKRGYQNIADTSLGFTSYGDSLSAIGKAGENGVVSLGDGGYAVLTFDLPIYNGPGFDFAVFENAFNDNFLELAFVEVSSDGQHFVRFPSVSLTDTSKQIGPFDNTGDATKLHNLAGKYRANYGTPFDLQDLDTAVGLDINNITHVRVVDVVGSIDPLYARYDAAGRPVNDPFPTPFNTGGFDLDAVGVIHQKNISTVYDVFEAELRVAPNPLRNFQDIKIIAPEPIKHIAIYSAAGHEIYQGNPEGLKQILPSSGMYIMYAQTSTKMLTKKILVF